MRVTRNLLHYDLRAAAWHFQGPMLMLRSDRDRAVNAALGPTLANMDGAENFRVVEIAGAGHCANLDQPERVRAEILTFLKEKG
jgi:3-oxoadipate enol-lactonase